MSLLWYIKAKRVKALVWQQIDWSRLYSDGMLKARAK